MYCPEVAIIYYTVTTSRIQKSIHTCKDLQHFILVWCKAVEKQRVFPVFGLGVQERNVCDAAKWHTFRKDSSAFLESHHRTTYWAQTMR